MLVEVDARADGSYAIVSITMVFEPDNNGIPIGLAPSRWFPANIWHRFET